MRSFTLTVTFPPERRHPMHALIDERDAVHRSELVLWNARDDAAFALLFRVLADRAVYEAALRETATIESYELVEAGPGELYLYVRETPPDRGASFVDAFAETDLVAVPPVTYLPGGRVTLQVLGEAAAVDAAVAALPDALDAELDAATGFAPVGDRVGLTARQREAIRAADRVGYYAVPREGSLADVAADLNVATSTAGDHLRKAEARIVRGYLDGKV